MDYSFNFLESFTFLHIFTEIRTYVFYDEKKMGKITQHQSVVWGHYCTVTAETLASVAK